MEAWKILGRTVSTLKTHPGTIIGCKELIAKDPNMKYFPLRMTGRAKIKPRLHWPVLGSWNILDPGKTHFLQSYRRSRTPLSLSPESRPLRHFIEG